MIVNGSVRPRPRVWMATVDSSQRPSVGRAAQNDLMPVTRTSWRMPPTSRERGPHRRRRYASSMSDLLRRLEAEDEELRFAAFTHDDAWELGARLRSVAAERRLPVAIAIWFGPQRVF